MNNNENDISNNIKIKISYLQMLLILSELNGNVSQFLKGLTITILVGGIFYQANTPQDDIKAILFVIALTFILGCIDIYVNQLYNWYQALYESARQIDERSNFFTWTFKQNFNYITNIQKFPELKKGIFDSIADPTFLLFYFPIIIIETIVLFAQYNKNIIEFLANNNLLFNPYIDIVIVFVILLIITIIYLKYKNLKEEVKIKRLFADDIEEKRTNFLDSLGNNNYKINVNWINKKKNKFLQTLDLASKKNVDIDLAALLLNEENNLTNYEDLNECVIYFNNRTNNNESIRLSEDSIIGSNLQETIFVDLQKIPQGVKVIRFVVSIYDGKDKSQNFNLIDKISINITDTNNNQIENIDFYNKIDNNSTFIIVGELINKETKWDFNFINDTRNYNRLGEYITEIKDKYNK